jgi:hypothetical protein
MTMTLGQACWKPNRVAEVITNIAKMDAGRVHDFLATHAPVLQMTDERLQVGLQEEQLHKSLWDGTRAHTLAVVFGDPGTGKSHVIHWLKLRCDQALESGEFSKACPVLVQRRTGSLKDALSQMVEQLPGRYHQYLQPIQQAIGNISQATARQMLTQKLALELGVLWQERKRNPLPFLLKDVAELCSSTGTRDWLCRDGGVIDRNVRRLTEASTVHERTALPEFNAAEFRIDQRHRKQNTPAVKELLLELEDSPELVTQAVDCFNVVLRDALNEMSGLGGTKLRDIFDQIRLGLKKDGLTLALFVEDVSVMSSLDKELFHAVEPQSRADLCPLVAVLGMTDAARTRLADNEKQRITHLITIGKDSLGWESNPEELARFTARYLNSVRLEETHTRQIAESRRQGRDVVVSACADCPVAQQCHQRFGMVEFDGVAVGLFPLTSSAPKQLLDALDEQKDGVRRNPRGFLDHLLRPLLRVDELQAQEFPRSLLLPIRPSMSHDWSAFEAMYCGSYSIPQRARLKLLAQAWVEADSLDSLAQALTPLLEPFGLPPLPVRLGGAGKPSLKGKPVLSTPTPVVSQAVRPAPASESKEFKELRASVEAWLSGPDAKFHKDASAKGLLFNFLKYSLPQDEMLGLPREEFEKLLNNKGRIHIEGQVSSAAVGPPFFIRFPRDQETAELILALGRFEFLGKNSWDFENSEHHKRVVARWLRKHGDRVLQSFQPEGLDSRLPLSTAVQILCLAAVLRRRAKLPSDMGELVREVVAPLEVLPISLSESGKWTKLLSTLHADHAEVRLLLLSELNVPQGIGGINFINPLPIIQAARAWMDEPQINPVAEAYFERFWKSRYTVLERAALYSDLNEALEPERAAVREALKATRDILSEAGFPVHEPGPALVSYCSQLLGLVESLKKTKWQIPDPEFDPVRREYAAPDSWARALQGATGLMEQQDVAPWLVFDPGQLKRAGEALARAAHYVARVESEISHAEKPLVAEGDPDVLVSSLLATLEAIGRLDESAEETE